MPETLWSDCPIVFCEIPRCPNPQCRTIRKPIIVRSLAGGDDSIARRCICRECSSAYVLVLEPVECELPETGSRCLDRLYASDER